MLCPVERDLNRYLNQLDADEACVDAHEAALEGLVEDFKDRATKAPGLVNYELFKTEQGAALMYLEGVMEAEAWNQECLEMAAQHWAERKIRETPEEELNG